MTSEDPPEAHDVTECLRRYAGGEPGALDDMMPLVYGELRRLADSIFRGQDSATIQPTVLVHEAYLRLAGNARELEGKQHFLAVAARAMRQILANHVRDRGAQKRGGGWRRVTFVEEALPWAQSGVDPVALDEALAELEANDERKARVAELRFFSGMTIQETADALGVSTGTVETDWAMARAWLRRRLANESGRDDPGQDERER